MSAERVVEAMLAQAAVVAVFGDRVALGQLPSSTDLTQKCLVYEFASDIPRPNVNHADGKARSEARVRLKVLGKEAGDVVSGHDALRAALDFTKGVVFAGSRVVVFRKVLGTQPIRDNDVGVWWRADDYLLAYYD